MQIRQIVLVVLLAAPALAQFRFDIDLKRDGPTSLVIYGDDGVLVRTVWDAAKRKAGRQQVEWDLLDDDGQPVKPGTYTYRTLESSAVRPRYIATIGNGRHPQVAGDLGGVEGMALFDVDIDDDGTIYTNGIGHGRSVQKISPDGKRLHAATNVSAVEVPSTIALGARHVFVVGDEGFYRLDKTTMQFARFGEELVVRFAQPPKWYPGGSDSDRLDAMLVEARDCVAADGGNDPRIHAWRGITRHPMKRYEGDRVRGAAVWGDRLLVADSHYDEVRLYDVESGERVGTWPGLTDPAGMVVRGEELLLVTDRQVVVLDRDGRQKSIVIGNGLERPFGIALGPRGLVHVTDLGIPNQVKVFGPDGRHLRSFGRAGSFNGRVTHDKLGIPRGIAVDGAGDIVLAEFAYNRIQKLSPAFEPRWNLQAFYCYLGTADQDDPRWIYGFEGPMLPVIKQFRVDLDTGKWELTRAWYFHKYDDAGSFYGYPSTGGGALTLDGHKFVYIHHKTMRVYRLDGDDLVPVVRIGPRISFTRADGTRAEYHRSQSPTYAIWHDENQDRRIRESEMSVLNEQEAAQRGMLWRSNDANITSDGTIYMGNLVLRCRGVIEGIPRYDWAHVDVTPISTPEKVVTIHGTAGVGVDDRGNRYYGIRESAGGAAEFKGMTFWAKRAGWQHVVKHAPDGRRLWRAGRKAYGHVMPGEFSYFSSLDWARGFVFVADWDGYVHVFSDDGLFVKRLFKGTREGAHQNENPYSITSYELGHVKTVSDPRTGRVYVVSQSLEGGEHIRAYEIQGLEEVRRTEGTFEVAAGRLVSIEPRKNRPSARRAAPTQRRIAITSVLEPPVVDGRLDTWTRYTAPETVGEAHDPAQVRILMRYDEKYLYLGARCDNDDSPARNAHYPKTRDSFWRGDCVSLFINTDSKADRAREKFTPRDHHLMLPLAHGHLDRPLTVYSWTKSDFIEQSEYRVQVPDERTWTMTARIPWAAFGPYVPVPGDTLHLNVQIDFGDLKGKAHLFALSLGGHDRSYAVPRRWNADGKIMYAR
ncbi:MAG: hypothetical protein CMJ18_24235 [Phycisphaeraceae bacterium]|nr:hypothetical protein [Phycisphaeraceae bacterium]